jgi:3D (Asp-Asp-Asp) domain-containing protein
MAWIGLLLVAFALPVAAADSVPTAPQAGAFADLPPDHWAYPAVETLLKAGVISADSSGRFRPNDPVRRSELFKMVLAARHIDVGTACAELFVDVPCSAWYAGPAETAYRMGIAEGKGADRFAPDDSVTRQELFTIIVRGLGQRWKAAKLTDSAISSQLTPFADRAAIAWWARPPVALAVSEGLANGQGGGLFGPSALTTRAEAAAAVSRVLLSADQLAAVQVDGRTVVAARALDMTASMYATGEPGVGSETYTGLQVRPGAIAVDPTVIPLGSLLYVEGYGYGIAADIGGAIKGNRIDLYSDSQKEANLFGLQTRRVWVLP